METRLNAYKASPDALSWVSHRRHPEEPLVSPHHQHHINRKATNNRYGIVRFAGRQGRNRPLGSAFQGDPIHHGPGQERAEQQQVVQHPVRE